jgi:hypothetical protein
VRVSALEALMDLAEGNRMRLAEVVNIMRLQMKTPAPLSGQGKKADEPFRLGE